MAARSEVRADARRSIERILDAGIACFARDTAPTMQDIAAEAGVGRVTVYAHFSTRAELVEAVLRHAIERGDVELQKIDLTGDPAAALERLVATSWRLSAGSLNIWAAAHEALPPGRIRELHDRPAERVGALLRRGQDEGVFRTDLPADWLVGGMHALMKLALDEVNAGRLEPGNAPDAIATSTRALWIVPPVN